MRRTIRWLGIGLADSVKAGLYPEERDQLWYQWRKGVQVAFRYWENWWPPAERPAVEGEIQRAVALLQSKGYAVLPAAGDVPFDATPVEVVLGEWPPMAGEGWDG